MGSTASLLRLITLALMWGSSFVWIKLALHGFSPWQITLLRVALASAVLVLLCWLAKQRLPREPKLWLAVAVPIVFGSVLPFTLFGVGERTVDSSLAGVLNSTTPLWTLLIALLLRQERGIGAGRITGLLLGFAGTVLILAPWQSGGLLSWGALACLAAAASYGVSYSYIGARLTGRVAPMVLTAMQLLGATALTLVLLPVFGRTPVEPAPSALLAVGVLGVFGTGVAFALMNRLIADDGPTAAASVGYLLPVVSVLLGAATLGEELNPRIIAGMLVVLLGVALSRRRAKPAEPADAADVPDVPVHAEDTASAVVDYTSRRSEAQRESS